MAYYSLHAYDADVWISRFAGLNKTATEVNGNPMFAEEECNLETPNGVLQPRAGMLVMSGGEAFSNIKIETLARFHRRWYTGNGSKDWLVAAAGGKLYSRQEGEEADDWIEIPMPTGVDSFQCNVWSWVTYEQNIEPADDDPYTLDVLLMTNQLDGMIMVSPPDSPRVWGDVASLTWDDMAEHTWDEWKSPAWKTEKVTIGTGDYKLGVIERYAERIWGGNVAGFPDKLIYSRPYDPTNWNGAGPDEQPEDCAGDIDQPTWDGDSFQALMTFGDQLIAFKKNRVWRVSGTNPGEYVFREQYGGGTSFFNTIVKDVERIFMASVDGMCAYDGASVSPYARDQVERIWRTINRDAMDQMTATMFKRRLYIAFPTGDSTVNNAMLVYDMNEGTILYHDNIYIESLLSTDTELYATSSQLPGKVLMLKYDSWLNGFASGAATRWVSPWMDFGYKRIVKGGFDLYFTPEVQNEAVTLRISMETEKKTKTKLYTVQPLTQAERAAGKEHRNKRLHFGGSGRKFRLIIETEAGSQAPWRLIGGMQMVVETDPD